MSEVEIAPVSKLSYFRAHKHDKQYIAKHMYNSRRSYYVRLFENKPELYAKSIRRLAIEDEEFAHEVVDFIAKKYAKD